MSGRIRSHLRSNVVGYLALFFALSGTAAALDGSNTVYSDDIVGGEVTQSDLGADSVNGAKVINHSLTSEDVKNDTNPVGGLASEDLKADSVGTQEIVDGGLEAADVNQFWAVVDANGTLARSSEPGVTVAHTAGTGTYTVDFNRTISDCAFNSTIGLSGSAGSSARGFTTVASASSSPSDSVLVTTDDISDPLDSAERGFHLQVSC